MYYELIPISYLPTIDFPSEWIFRDTVRPGIYSRAHKNTFQLNTIHKSQLELCINRVVEFKARKENVM